MNTYWNYIYSGSGELKSSNFFSDALKEAMNNCDSVDIISGYVGKDTLKNFEPRMIDMVRAGGRVRLLCGMAAKQPVAKKTLDVLRALDSNLRLAGPGNGIFSFKYPIHAKVYITYDQDNEPISMFCGSSNFNFSNTNMECTARIPNHQPTVDFVNRLFGDGSSILDISAVPERGSSRDPLNTGAIPELTISTRSIDLSNLNLVESVDLKKITQKSPISSLNLYHGKGRLANNVYTPRPWYEAEVTLGKDNYPGIPRDFLAITDDGFEIEMQRRSGGPKGHPELGLKDLTSKGKRAIFGKWIKGKLEGSGALLKTELIDDSTFESYGTNMLEFYSISDNELYMRFEP